MDWENLQRQMEACRNDPAIAALVRSKTGERAAARIDGSALEKALRQGDEKALRGVLESVLQTEEGRALAESLRRTVDGHGR